MTALDRFSNIPLAFLQAASEYAALPVYEQAFAGPSPEGSKRRARITRSFAEVKDRVGRIAAFLAANGFLPQEKAAILSATRPEWMEVDLAILAAGGVSVSVHPSLPDQELAYILHDAGCAVVFAENQEQVNRVQRLSTPSPVVLSRGGAAAKPTTLSLKRIIAFEDVDAAADVVTLGAILNSTEPSFNDTLINRLTPDNIAALVYTSGTTGTPKGVMQSHGNHLANLRQAFESKVVSEDQSIMLILPLAHSFGKLLGYIGFLTPVLLKFPAVIDRYSSKLSPESYSKDICEADAGIIPVVPRLLEKMREGILGRAGGKGLAALLLRFAIWAADRRYQAVRSGGKVGLSVRATFFFSSPVRRALRERLFGRRLAYCISGGAKLFPEVTCFFDALGIEVLEGYGLTETVVATNINRPGRNRIGTVGPVLADDIEVRIAGDGEILFRGPNVAQGYYKRAEETRAAWDSEGWFHTGDFGSLDPEGCLVVSGRKKDIIVTSNGKNIAPEAVESKLSSSPDILQAVVLGDSRPYLISIVVPADSLLSLAKAEAAKTESSYPAIVLELVQDAANKACQDLPKYMQPRKFLVAGGGFTVENGLLTPTLKVRRAKVADLYTERIEQLYQR